jgi:MFS family permease
MGHEQTVARVSYTSAKQSFRVTRLRRHEATSCEGSLSRVSASEGRTIALVALVILISNIDRGNLAIAGPLIRDELHLTATRLGLLISCFYWTYTAVINPAAWAARRFGAREVLAVCVALWSVATGLTSLAGGFMSLLLMRLLLGVGESGVFPCSTSVVATEVPPAMRGRANAWMATAIALGPALGTFAGGLLMSRLGWRPMFALLGCMSLLWLWPWLRQAPHAADALSVTRPTDLVPLKRILREPALWGATLGRVSGGYTYTFMISWMPTFLVQMRGFSMASMGTLIGAAYVLRAASSMAIGPLIDRWMARGIAGSSIHKTILGIGVLGNACCLAGVAFGSAAMVIASLFVYEFFSGLNTTAQGSFVQWLAGPRATGTWVGFQDAGASLAAIVAPALTGMIIDATGSFNAAFALGGLMIAIGFVGWVVVVPNKQPVCW